MQALLDLYYGMSSRALSVSCPIGWKELTARACNKSYFNNNNKIEGLATTSTFLETSQHSLFWHLMNVRFSAEVTYASSIWPDVHEQARAHSLELDDPSSRFERHQLRKSSELGGHPERSHHGYSKALLKSTYPPPLRHEPLTFAMLDWLTRDMFRSSKMHVFVRTCRVG